MLEDISGEQIKEQFKSNKNLRLGTITVGGLLVVILGFFAYRQFVHKPASVKSQDSYWRGLNHAKVDSTDLALDAIRPAVKKYSGKVGGENAQFILARLLMEKGEFQNALNELEDVDVADTYLSILKVGLQADCQSQLKDYEAAANSYMSAADMSPNDWTTPMYLMKAGLCAEEIKNFEKATECYQRVKDDYSSYGQTHQVDKYIARTKDLKTGK